MQQGWQHRHSNGRYNETLSTSQWV
uniref:Uncharacterized protein n=1 Tax=Anguilla anguilla TaxID=7936 RepID=A0A0E9W0C1_ANGAN